METDAASIFDHYLNYAPLYIYGLIFFFPITYTHSIKIKKTNNYGEKLKLTHLVFRVAANHTILFIDVWILKRTRLYNMLWIMKMSINCK
jgi:hypothetical protein